MYNIKINGKKNRLYVTLKEPESIEMKGYIKKIEYACKKLVAGFTCITRIYGDGLVKLKVQDLLFSMEELIFTYGVSKVIRVTKMKSSLFFWKENALINRPEYRIEHASTLYEAERILDNIQFNIG